MSVSVISPTRIRGRQLSVQMARVQISITKRVSVSTAVRCENVCQQIQACVT